MYSNYNSKNNRGNNRSNSHYSTNRSTSNYNRNNSGYNRHSNENHYNTQSKDNNTNRDGKSNSYKKPNRNNTSYRNTRTNNNNYSKTYNNRPYAKPNKENKKISFNELYNKPGIATTLIENANEKVAKDLASKSTKELYDIIIFAISKNNDTGFVSGMQSYIVHLANILMECYNDPIASYYKTCLRYICCKVCESAYLYNFFKIFNINSSGNKVKHSKKDIMVWMGKCVNAYNEIIEKIIAKTGLSEFKASYISLNKKISERDKPIFKENLGTKFGSVKGINYRIQINKHYKLDVFTKTIIAQFKLFVQGANPGYKMNINIYQKGSSNPLKAIKKIELDQNNLRNNYELTLKSDSLDHRCAYFDVEIEVYKNVFSVGTDKQNISMMFYEDAQVKKF